MDARRKRSLRRHGKRFSREATLSVRDVGLLVAGTRDTAVLGPASAPYRGMKLLLEGVRVVRGRA